MTIHQSCPACHAAIGEPHAAHCDAAPAGTLWTGHWPGVLDCQALGWYYSLKTNQPCAPTAPDAREDLNRLALYQHLCAQVKNLLDQPDGSPERAEIAEELITALRAIA